MSKRVVYIMFLLLGTLQVMIATEKFPENSMNFLKELLNFKQDEALNDSILSGGVLSVMKQYDFSPIWLEQNDALLGFIGTDNYQRIQIRFLSIIKDPTDPVKYFVYGKSKVNSTICSFLGEIHLSYIMQENIKEEEKQTLFNEFQNEGEEAARFMAPEYVLVAQYVFYEDSKVQKTGKFAGALKSHFYLYENRVYYNNLRMELDDGYKNNQYAGVWTSYATSKSKICNWGEFRIPSAADLDIGVGEFSPNPKYHAYGWASYSKMLSAEDKRAREQAINEERREWWK